MNAAGEAGPGPRFRSPTLQTDCRCEPFSSILDPMDSTARPPGLALNPGVQSLSVLSPGATASVIGVGAGGDSSFTPIERRLIELGFVHGEHIEIIAQAMPGGDPFVVRVGTSTFALRRREVESVWVEPTSAPTPT
jgi:ferrous iron transport protein A